MITAYDQVYIERAQITLGCMLDYAVLDLKCQLKDFHALFLASGFAKRFGNGDAQCIAGNSGAELALRVLEQAGLKIPSVQPEYRNGRSKEFWTGWALAYYQWQENISFKKIDRFISIEKIYAMYEPYHEMDIRQFIDALNKIRHSNISETSLARLRKYAGLSQSMLAKQSDVSVRTIQQYEQRQKKIEKAGTDQLQRLSRVLCCNTEALL